LSGDDVKITKNEHEFEVINTYDWFWKLFDNGEWEPETFKILDRFLSPEVSYVDLGSWIGPTVLYASKLCNKCYAVEPDPIAYKTLVKNISLNNITNIKTFNEAIFDYDGVLTIGNSGGLGNSATRIDQSENNVIVICKTLQSFVDEYEISSPIFIKMDVEGSEEFIFKSIEFFAKYKPIVYVSLHPTWFKNYETCMETIRKVGRLYKHCYDVNLQEVNIEGNEWVVFAD
jgi:FkbM family methyltransferase